MGKSPRHSDVKFTSKEEDVLACLLNGKSSKKIAAILNIQAKSVDTHIYNMTHKLGLHSRGDLISLIEQSAIFDHLHAHYAAVLRVHHFKEAVQKTASYTRRQNIMCSIMCTNAKLLKKVIHNLKKVGIGVVAAGENGEDEQVKSIRIILPSASSSTTATISTLTSGFLEPFPVYHTGNDEALFFEIVHHLCPSAWTNEACAYFVQDHADGYKRHDQPVMKRFRFWWISMLCVVFLCLLFVCAFLYMRQSNVVNAAKAVVINSVCAIPERSQRLERRQLLTKMEQCFNKRQNIQTVVLVGIGGSGKTMLARQYAKNQQCPIVWEINAETKNTVLESFSHLAWTLSTTQEEKIELERMKNGKDQQWYYKQLIHFVREKLVQGPPWFLLFDDVSILPDIQEFLPTNTKAWGKGNVLITTRNNEIGQNHLVDRSHVIRIDELTPQEKLVLFIKLQGEPVAQMKKLENFLAVLPSFPLDIELAANYIKNTNSSYEDYLQQIQSEYSKIKGRGSFLPTDMSRDIKTRQGIIACAVERMLGQHKDFMILLLLVSTIGHQNIPKNLLKKCIASTVVDQFVQQMHQSSLLYGKTTASGATLSIHRSTKEAVFHYLMNILTPKEKQEHFHQLVQAICNYCEDVIESLDHSILQIIAPHVLMFSNHVTGENKTKIDFHLGCVYYCLGNYSKAKEFFDKIVLIIKADRLLSKEKRKMLLKALVYRGAADTRAGNFEDAKISLEESLKIYHDVFLHDQTGLAFALMYYGRLCREMNAYKEATYALTKSLAIYTKYYGDNHPKTAWALFRLGEVQAWLGRTAQAKACYIKSLKTYQEKYGKNHRRTLWIKFRLGTVYKTEGDYLRAVTFFENVYNIYKEKYKEDRDIYTLMVPHLGDTYRRLGLHEKARTLLETAHKMTLCYYGQHNIHAEWCAALVGRLYTDMGYHGPALKILEQSLAIHNTQLGKNHLKTVLVKRALAHAYSDLGELARAKTLYNECLQAFEQYFGKSHAEYARLVCRYGQLFLYEKNYPQAEKLLKQALLTLETKKHADAYRCYECLGDMYTVQGNTRKAQEAYYHAFRLVQRNFSKNSVHIVRLSSKISLVQRYCFRMRAFLSGRLSIRTCFYV